MSINLEVPRKFGLLVNQAHQVATEVFRPISRKYDQAEHEYPKELDMLASVIDGSDRGRIRESHGHRFGAARTAREDQDRRVPHRHLGVSSQWEVNVAVALTPPSIEAAT